MLRRRGVHDSGRSGRVLAIAALGGAISWSPVGAEEATKAEVTKIWSNETELSIVVTEGNSDTQTLGFKNTLTRRKPEGVLRVKLEALRASTADDWYRQVDPGFVWEPGAEPPEGTQTLVKPDVEPDVENYFAEGRYDQRIRENFNWHAGASWDRNEDAGILNRYIAFGGLGNAWWSRDDLRFHTSYGLSWTDREEESPDPEKDDRFLGARLGSTYLNKIGENTIFTNDWTTNVNLSDTGDWNSDMTNALSISMNKKLSIRISLRWLYASEPALEEVDIIARVAIRDPDGVPGSGDEYFETIADGGTEITLGETEVRKETFDQVFKTTLVLSF